MVDSIVLAIATVVVCSVAFYFLSGRKNKNLLGKAIPGPEPSLFGGNLSEMKDSVSQGFELLHKRYGRVLKIEAGPFTVVSVGEPEMVDEVLKNYKNYTNSKMFRDSWGKVFPESVIILEGEEWKHIRKLVQDGVQRQRLGNLMIQARDIMLSLSDRLKSDGFKDAVNMESHIVHVLFDAFGRFGYGVEYDTVNGKNLDALKKGMELWAGVGVWQNVPVSWFKYLPLPINLRVWSNARWLRNFAVKLITQRRAELAAAKASGSHDADDANNLLDALIKARDDESGAQLTEDQIIDNVVLLFFASFETTSGSVCFALDEIARHPEVQEKLYKEVAELADDFEHWTDAKQILNAVESLPYLEMVIKEAQRLRPVAPGVPRTALHDMNVYGYHVSKDSIMVLNNVAMCKDHKLWGTTEEDIQKFRPERWEKIDAADMKNTYLPFGAGSRMCIGFRIANLEMKVLIATLLRAFKLRDDPTRPCVMTGVTTVKPKNGCYLFLEPRK